jgi:addiction module HigA family antidote
MSDKLTNQFRPNYAVPPGATLLDTLEELGMSQVELAQRMGRPLKTINEIIKGKAAITAETALQLEKVLGIPASFWNSAERNYQETFARLESEERLRTQIEWLKEIPVSQMTKWAWIRKREEPAQQLDEVLNFFGVASSSAWQGFWREGFEKRLAVEFRKSPAFESKWVALAAWLRKGEIEAQQIQCDEFAADKFKRALQEIRTLTVTPPEVFQSRLVNLSAQSGVAVTFVPPLPKTHVSGATLWLSTWKALLQLSVRGKSDDLLWFAFFHEAGHILLHGKKDVFIESGEIGEKEKEKEANEFAANFLIPRSEFRRFVFNRRITKEKVRQFANELGIAPGIVVGRLQHEKIIPMSHLNDLKLRFELAT